jgi:hypothetical protein
MSEKVEVELDIFSGRPNPTWTLSDADGRFFLKLLDKLATTSTREFSGNLGYRGFTVEVSNATEKERVRIQNGLVHVRAANKEIYYNDHARTLERWLFESGKPFLESKLLQVIESEFPDSR